MSDNPVQGTLPRCCDCNIQQECRYSTYPNSSECVLICLKCHYKRMMRNRFTFHSLKDDQGKKYTANREMARKISFELIDTCPISLELDEALKKLDEVVFWANAAIARNS